MVDSGVDEFDQTMAVVLADEPTDDVTMELVERMEVVVKGMLVAILLEMLDELDVGLVDKLEVFDPVLLEVPGVLDPTVLKREDE